jgi:hypothetical protein
MHVDLNVMVSVSCQHGKAMASVMMKTMYVDVDGMVEIVVAWDPTLPTALIVIVWIARTPARVMPASVWQPEAVISVPLRGTDIVTMGTTMLLVIGMEVIVVESSPKASALIVFA